MFIPYDYQLDYLKALHLLYYAFPPPVKVTYYTLGDREVVSKIWNPHEAIYEQELDDTSPLKYYEIKNLPVYYITGGEQKSQNAEERGSILQQDAFQLVVPGVFGLKPTNYDLVCFSSSFGNRFFRVQNIETTALFEDNPLRMYRLSVSITKYKSFPVERVLDNFIFAYEYGKIMKKSDYEQNNFFLDLINLQMRELDIPNKTLQYPYIDIMMTKSYNDFKIVFNTLLSMRKFNFRFIKFTMPNYSTHPFALFLDYPTQTEIQGIDNIDKISEDFENLKNENADYEYKELKPFTDDYFNNDLKMKVCFPDDKFKTCLITWFLAKKTTEIIEINNEVY